MTTQGTSSQNDSKPTQPTANHYEILGIEPTSSKLTIREAYLRLKHTFSTGSEAMYSLISEGEAKQALSQIEEAFSILNDENRRDSYDRTINIGAPHTKKFSAARIPDPFGSHLSQTEHAASSLRQESSYHQNTVHEGHWSMSAPRQLPLLSKVFPDAITAEYKEAAAAILAKGVFVGADLTALRELAHVTIGDMQNRTKISLEHLRAMESDEFKRLPATVYVRGFLRHCLKFLNITDPDQYIKTYTDRMK